jgi:large subunit ribosomal protein L1
MSKRLQQAYKLFDKNNVFGLKEALEVLLNYKQEFSCKFDESVDVCFGMNLDPKKADQNIKSFAELPHGNGKTFKIAVFANDENIDKALKAGASYAGADELISSIELGKVTDFDKCVATPLMMPKLAKIAKILGPKGLMPNPKLGTVTNDVVPVIEALLKGRADFKVDKDGYIKLSIGRLSFPSQLLIENIKEVYSAIKNIKPASVKSTYFDSLSISSSGGVGLKVKLSDLF